MGIFPVVFWRITIKPASRMKTAVLIICINSNPVKLNEKGKNYTGWAFMLEGMRRRTTISGTWAEVFTLMSKFAFFPVDPR